MTKVARTPLGIAGDPRAVGSAPPAPANGRPGEDTIAVQVQDLNLYYGERLIVAGVNLSINSHEITAVIGPSGSGKSTFIRSLNRMHELSPGQPRVTGTVRLGDWNLYAPATDPVQVRRRVGMVFQKPNPFPTMSIYDNVVAGLRLEGRLARSVLDEAVEGCLRQAALWDEVKDKLRQSGVALSGGQQQRLCIARAIAVKPDVILMDEPCSALDPIATLKVEDLMRELERDYTIIVVTHNMQQAARVSDRTAFFSLDERHQGILIEVGATREIFTNPRDQRTEDYITGRFG